jgi:hypothetical protein
MQKFTISEVKEIRGRQKFFKLLVNYQCPFDSFWNKIENEGNLADELRRVLAIMDQVAQLKQPLPKIVFRELKGRKRSDAAKEYEIKTPNLRVYIFHDEGIGKVIVCGDKKKMQIATIKYFRNLKKLYFKEKSNY